MYELAINCNCCYQQNVWNSEKQRKTAKSYIYDATAKATSLLCDNVPKQARGKKKKGKKEKETNNEKLSFIK